jgi:hypothetical protein
MPVLGAPVTAPLAFSAGPGPATFAGCSLVSSGLPGAAFQQSLRGILLPDTTSGDARLDGALGHVLAAIASLFAVHPGFGFYDDRGNPNAIATDEPILAGTEGSVVFGLTLLQEEMAQSEMSIVAICAHEFGHIAQYFHQMHDRLVVGQRTKRRVELHADFLAGYYLAKHTTSYAYDELRALALAWQVLGAADFTNPDHHGTGAERLGAIQQGFLFAAQRPEFRLAAALEVAARYVEAL